MEKEKNKCKTLPKIQNKKNCKKNTNKGITLIALVITIIVLLILAGVTIALITGNESASNKAADAKIENDKGAMKDAASMLSANFVQEYYENVYVNSNDTFKSTYSNIGDYVKAQFDGLTEGGFTYAVSGNTLTVTDTKGNTVSGTILDSGKIDWSNTNISNNNNNNNNNQGVGEEPPVFQTVLSKKTASGGTVSAVNSLSNITLIDDLENEVIIPAGFGIAEDSGTKVEEGIVIEDATNGNQFVWVPVGTNINVSTTISATGKIDIPLSRYIFDEYGTAVAKASNYEIPDIENVGDEDDIFYTETVSNSSARLTSDNTQIEFVKQANEKGGFYIARYEAGITGEIANNSLTSSKRPTTDGSVKPLSKEGVGVWNFITKPNAVVLSQNMYGVVNTTENNVTIGLFASDLISSYAWDTAIVFIQKCGTNSIYSKQIGEAQTDSIATTGTNVLKYESDGITELTGDVKDVQCNIYDMAGNVCEFTTESTNDSAYCSTLRGSAYKDEGIMSSDRGSYQNSKKNATIGFRPVLYIL